MIKPSVIKLLAVATFATVIGFTGCKGEGGKSENDGNIEVVGDSINPTGSDGLGREIDTVEQIERSQQDTIVRKP